MRHSGIAAACSLLAGLVLTAPLCAEDKPDFNWSWEEEGGSPSVQPPAAAAAPAAGMDPETYNQLLKENLNLRRKLQDTDRGSEAMREENARLQSDMSALQAKIAASTDEMARLKRDSVGTGDPEKLVELEASLAAAESAKLKLAQELAALESRLDRAESKPPVATSTVKPGSDLFVSLESENAELRSKLADVETEKQKVLKQLRDVESEVEAKGDLEAQMVSAGSESDKHKMVIRKLLERVPELEQDLAETQSREREKDAELSQREREMRALKAELDRREDRLKKVERVAVLLARSRSEVQSVDSTRQRDMYYNMGVVFANRGQFKDAEREYLRALRQDPTDADSHYNLAVLYDQNLKQYREAVSHYRRYLKLRPDAPDGNQVRIWIATAETK